MSTRKNIKYSLNDVEVEYGKLTFAQVIRDHRLGEGLTQEEMSNILEISKQSLCDLEKGRRIPSPKRAASIAKKLGLIPETLISLAIQDSLRNEKLYYAVSLFKLQKKNRR